MEKKFLKFLSNVNKEKIYPEKCSYCNLCNWRDVCEKWEDDNYINLVAGSNFNKNNYLLALISK